MSLTSTWATEAASFDWPRSSSRTSVGLERYTRPATRVRRTERPSHTTLRDGPIQETR